MGKKNVLLLALSTIPKDPTLTDFTVEEDDTVIAGCIGQMEPVVRLRLKDQNLPLEIITLCTDDVKENRVTFKVEGNGLSEEDITAFEFLEKRVKEFSENIEITQINLDEKNPNDGIKNAVDHIRQEKADIKELWIDTHGGFREVSLVMEAVVSLLKVDDIIPDRIYGVRYGEGEKVIVDQRASFGIFDFVSGMNEFIDYGSVNILNRYYEKDKREDIKNLLAAMNRVAHGTQECDTEEYEKGLDELGDALENLSEDDSMLGIFKTYVRESYGNLLNKEKRKTIDIVKRCVSKGLLQQALTFIESRMPREYVERRIIYYNPHELEEMMLTQEQRKEVRHPDQYKKDENFVVDLFVNNTLPGTSIVDYTMPLS